MRKKHLQRLRNCYGIAHRRSAFPVCALRNSMNLDIDVIDADDNVIDADINVDDGDINVNGTDSKVDEGRHQH